MVTKVRQLIKLYQIGASQREISRELNLSRTSVKIYLDRLKSTKTDFNEILKKNDASILAIVKGKIYRKEPDARMQILKPLLEGYSLRLKRRYQTIQLIWEDYYDKYGDKAYSYSSFRNHLQNYIHSNTYEYHNTHIAGDVLQVDFAGDPLYITDPQSGIKKKVVILCCIMPYSSYTFVYAMEDASMDNFFDGLSKCLSYIGGVPTHILSDNMKQWVTRREKDGPIFNEAAKEFGFHYSTIISATRVRKPKDKAAVESSVHRAYLRIYSPLYNETFYSIELLNKRIIDLVDALNNRKMKEKEFSRKYYFDKEEKIRLQSLPADPFILKYTRMAKVGPNYHVNIDTHRYSVPYEYVNKEVNIVYTKDTVEIYNSFLERIAIHERSYKKFKFTTNKLHMPPNHKIYEAFKKHKNRQYFLEEAEKIDDSVVAIIRQIFNNAACEEQANTSCEALLQLYNLDNNSFILSCQYAERHLLKVNYKIIHQVMVNNIYMKDYNKTDNNMQINHANLRGKKEYYC